MTIFENSKKSQTLVSNRISLTPKHKVQRDSKFNNGYYNVKNGSPSPSRISKMVYKSSKNIDLKNEKNSKSLILENLGTKSS